MEIIIKPILTEKMTVQGEKLNRYGFIVDVRANKLQIRNAVAIHQNAALCGAEYLGEGKAEVFAVFAAENVRDVNAVSLEIILHIVAELIVGYAGDEAALCAEPCKADSYICGRAADVFVEVAALGERLIHIGGVEVDGDPAYGDDVKGL